MTQRNATTIGIDLGDQTSQVCILTHDGEVSTRRITTHPEAFRKFFRGLRSARVALEAGTHSPWVERELSALGFKAMVADPRRLEAVTKHVRKSDRTDAVTLAILARDPMLLCLVHHRSEADHADLMTLLARDAAVRGRTMLVNLVRSGVKGFGARIRTCDARSFHRVALEELPSILEGAFVPLLELLKGFEQTIKKLDRAIEQIRRKRIRDTRRLSEIPGVGPILSTAYVLTIADPSRFRRSRTVGAFVGLTARRSQSGARDPELHITKAGNPFLRKLLVQSAHYVLGRGPDSALRRFGERIAARGGKAAKKRAVIAVARKLAVLLHRLWSRDEEYQPFPVIPRRRALVAATA